MKRSILRSAAPVLIVTVVASVVWVNAGDLNPPAGPVAPTMKTLDQIEARVIVNATHTPGDAANSFIISAPGSYYLAGNLTGEPGKHGISIRANDVTLDLNGFALISGGGAVRGVNVPAAQTNFSVRNGSVRGWADGGVQAGAATTLAEKLRLSDNVGATGLSVGNGSMIKDCVATGNGTGFYAPDRTQVTNCISTVNTGDGFTCTSYVTMTDCTSSRNGLRGIVLQVSCNVTHCNASRNDIDGLVAGSGCTIADCTAGSNGYHGISVDTGSTVQNCTGRANGSAGVAANSACHLIGNTCDANNRGIYASSGNRIDGNNCTSNALHGYSINGTHNIIVRNSARANATNYSVPAANATGPIVDVTAGGMIVSTSPWANFSY